MSGRNLGVRGACLDSADQYLRESDHMTPLSQANLRARLESSRQELLDLGLRNSLLNYRCLRGKGVEIVDEKPPEISRLLVVERKAFTFLPIDDDQEIYRPPAEITDQPGHIAERHHDTKLQTSLKTKQLHDRLLATYYAANTYIEEQGVNILFLALGMLKWYESDDSGKPYRSPRGLVMPVSNCIATRRIRRTCSQK